MRYLFLTLTLAILCGLAVPAYADGRAGVRRGAFFAPRPVVRFNNFNRFNQFNRFNNFNNHNQFNRFNQFSYQVPFNQFSQFTYVPQVPPLTVGVPCEAQLPYAADPCQTGGYQAYAVNQFAYNRFNNGFRRFNGGRFGY